MSLIASKLPDHNDLPSEDETMVHNFQEHPLSMLLTETILPRLEKLFPSGWYTIGQDSFIYWQQTDPPVDGAKAPDWFVVLNVPPGLEGNFRRSYVLWQENIPPLLLLEFVSDDSGYERDRTPNSGKFWVYEQQVRAPYYGIFDAANETLEMYRLIEGQYQLQTPNEYGRYPLPALGVELGIWLGTRLNINTAWLRWWDAIGTLLPTGDERADAERQRADTERQRADTERHRADTERQRADTERQEVEKLKDKLRSLGIDPDAL